MYAVIATGGKQAKVAEGQTLDVELLSGDVGSSVTFSPVLVVDGANVLTGPAAGNAKVSAKILGRAKGPKIDGFKYKSKANERRRFGHRQHYTTIQITSIATA
jgi:large subunit ribosomal protein L21